MPIECKVSNSAVNSVKRLNNDAAVKRVVGKMLRFYTLGRADEAAVDKVLAVEEHVFPFDGADVL